PEVQTLLTAAAELFVRGVPVDWTGVLPAGAGAGQVDLPTYAFDHEHYWLRTAPAADVVSLGQESADHPLLGAVVRLPQSDGLVCTSRLSLRTHPWLADRVVGGVVPVPGTGLVELVVRAGDEVGCGTLEELVIEAPLVVPEQGGVRVQVTVGGLDEHGTRSVAVYSARSDSGGEIGANVWTRHATGSLGAGTAESVDISGFDFAVWPPAGAESVPLDVAGFYEEVRGRGYGYGPVFQGLRAVWRRGDELFAEVALPEEQRDSAARFGLHPALLDAALHPTMVGMAFADPAGEERADAEAGMLVPFSWTGLRLHAAGASELRVRVVQSGPDAVSLQAADWTGAPVLSLQSLVARPEEVEQLGRTAADDGRDLLFGVEWSELLVPMAGSQGLPSWLALFHADEVEGLAADVTAP
ncbi:polyketide synthase dehydratase domain-containing protein, partial [Streptomyces tendae]|uniref:polyketide synthase dehydratase domain-containing protein n=1 Tax=Streptomyces tendae TaxID=1932 RepID=UPI00371CF154